MGRFVAARKNVKHALEDYFQGVDDVTSSVPIEFVGRDSLPKRGAGVVNRNSLSSRVDV